MAALRFLKLPEVIEMTSLSKAQIYRWQALGQFPQSFKMGGHRTGGPGAVRWRADEIEEWLATRPRSNAVNGRGR